MATVTINHSVVTGAAANPDVLVDGVAWDATHTVSGLENVDNTSDANKPVSTATQTALDAKISSSLLTTRGDIIYRNATVPARLAKGALGTVLTMGSDDPAWAAPSGFVALPSPATNLNVPIFNGTSGEMKDSNILSVQVDSSKEFVGIGDNVAEAVTRWSGTKMPLITTDRSVNWTSINDQTISDFTVVTPIDSTSNQYASFASNIKVPNTQSFNINHLAGFEDLMNYSGLGTLDEQYSFLSLPTISGPLITRMGVNISDALGAGVIQNNIGVRVRALSRGTATNYAIQTDGTTPSLFGGTLTSTKVGAGSNASFVAGNATLPSFGWSMTAAASNQKNWDAAATSTTLLFRAVSDDNLSAATWMTVTRGAGATVSSVAIPNLIGPVAVVKKQIFTSSGTYTPSTGLLYCIIECVGGGGGGGGAFGISGNVLVAGGGGSGGYSRLVASAATIGASKTVTIGAAGNGGATGANAGSAGGDTSVSTLCIGKGGAGGQQVSASVFGLGGAGGVAGTGDLTAAGAPGFNGYLSTGISLLAGGGNGGSSKFGGGSPASAIANATATAGAAGSAYGSGGAGGNSTNTTTTSAGGNGSAGVVFITEFTNQ